MQDSDLVKELEVYGEHRNILFYKYNINIKFYKYYNLNKCFYLDVCVLFSKHITNF